MIFARDIGAVLGVFVLPRGRREPTKREGAGLKSSKTSRDSHAS